MITIEVLVSMLILFLVISTSTTMTKFFQNVSLKKDIYEDEYITLLSLKDKLSNTICSFEDTQEGEFNGYKYKAECENIKQSRTYIKGVDEDEKSGLYGNYMVKLNKVKLLLEKEKYSKNFEYYLTTNEKLYSE